MKLIGMIRELTRDSLVLISETETKIVTRGKLYKFALLIHPKSYLKKVFRVKSVYLKIYSSKLDETGWNGYKKG